MWLTSWIAEVLQKVTHKSLEFQHCMHGGTRNKKTTLKYSVGLLLEPLAVMCDGQHIHAPWGRNKDGSWATAGERNYPRLLCQRWAKCIARSFDVATEKTPVDRYAIYSTRPQDVLKPEDDGRVLRNLQPRKRAAELVPEFKETLEVILSSTEAAELKRLKKTGAKITRIKVGVSKTIWPTNTHPTPTSRSGFRFPLSGD